MKISELRGRSDTDLRGEITGLLREAFNLRMQKGTGQVPRPHQFGRIRKDVARIKTVLAERKRTQA